MLYFKQGVGWKAPFQWKKTFLKIGGYTEFLYTPLFGADF